MTHVDYSARIQTVHAETNPRYHALLSAFKRRTGCAVLVNTSFNVRGEPIVCTPEDAFRCFMGTEMERLVIGDCILHKDEQSAALKLDYKNAFELDRYVRFTSRLRPESVVGGYEFGGIIDPLRGLMTPKARCAGELPVASTPPSVTRDVHAL